MGKNNSTSELSIDTLQKELQLSQQSLADANSKAADLENKFEASINDVKIQVDARMEEKEQTDARIAKLEAENEALQKVNDELTCKMESLTDELNKRKNPGELLNEAKEKGRSVLPDGTFKVDGREYKFLSPVFKFRGQRILATEAINNQELLEALVSAKVGVIVEVK